MTRTFDQFWTDKRPGFAKGFGQTVQHWPYGLQTEAVTIKDVVVNFYSADPRGPQRESQGIDDRHGRRADQTCYLDLPPGNYLPDDKFLLADGTLVNAVRVVGTNGSSVKVVGLVPGGISTKRTRTRP